MELKISEFGDIRVVHLEGKLDVGLSINIETEFEKMMDSGILKIIVDLKDVEYLSSSGLRIFIAAMRKLKEKNGMLVLCCITPMVKKIFKIVELEDLFEIYNTVEEAIKACE